MMSGKGRILVAEDEVMIGMMLEDFLDALGYGAAGICRSVGEGESLLDAGARVDAAILDCQLEDGAVWPLARRLRDSGVPFIFATGNNGHGIPEDLSAVPTLDKPFSMDALGRVLGDILSS